MKIHRAIRKHPDTDEHFLYHIQYTGSGVDIIVEDMSMHEITPTGIIGPNACPPGGIKEPTTMLCAVTILIVDRVHTLE